MNRGHAKRWIFAWPHASGHALWFDIFACGIVPLKVVFQMIKEDLFMRVLLLFLTFCCAVSFCACSMGENTQEGSSDMTLEPVVTPEVTVPDTTESKGDEPMQEMDYGYVDKWGGEYTFGVIGKDKTVEEQRGEILAAMNRAIQTETVWKEVPSYHPTLPDYDHIKAITYEGFVYQGQKTKIFAYVGFPEGASSENPVPAVVLVHGGGGHPYMEWVRLWNEKGYAAIAMETTGCFPSAPNVGVGEGDNEKFVYGLHGIFLEEGFGNAPGRDYPTSYAEVEDQWAYHGLTQVILASNILRQDDRVITDQIGITGISWGGVMVSQIIGYDQRYAFAIPTYGTAYLGDPVMVFQNWDEPYIQALWAAERLLDNATMPIMWYTYADDNNFGVNSYVKSYKHTEGFNDKNILVMLKEWGHSHSHVFWQSHPYLYADWVIKGEGGIITVLEQPTDREIVCRLNVPSEATDISVTVNYITERMTYGLFDKFNWGRSYTFLEQFWQSYEAEMSLGADGILKAGKIPEEAAGYYLSIRYKIGGIPFETSSIYVDCFSTKKIFTIYN